MLVNQGPQDGALLRRDRLPCAVAGQADVAAVPSVAAGNAASHGVDLGQMNLYGYLAPQRIHYGSEKSDDFTDALYPQHSITSLACRTARTWRCGTGSPPTSGSRRRFRCPPTFPRGNGCARRSGR